MKLSGWARVWIVASVIWWSTGAWWLTENYGPTYIDLGPVHPDQPPELSESTRAMLQSLNTAQERAEAILDGKPVEPAPTIAKPETPSSFVFEKPLPPRNFRLDWTPWFLKLGVVVIAPFLAALAFIIGRRVVLWVWRGFQTS